MASLPAFNGLWGKYPAGSTVVSVKRKIFGSEDAYPGIRNACALRMSIAFNEVNHLIPGRTPTAVKGIDGHYYLRGSRAMRRYIDQHYRTSNIRWENPRRPTDKKPDTYVVPSEFQDKQGLVFFHVRVWGNAGGHLALWNKNEFANGHHDNYFRASDYVLMWVFRP